MEMPKWASKGAHNGRGKVVTTVDQYVALVEVENTVMEAIVDTGGARSLIDYASARALGW